MMIRFDSPSHIRKGDARKTCLFANGGENGNNVGFRWALSAFTSIYMLFFCTRGEKSDPEDSCFFYTFGFFMPIYLSSLFLRSQKCQ